MQISRGSPNVMRQRFAFCHPPYLLCRHPLPDRAEQNARFADGHELEILFNPLTSIEVLTVRSEGMVVIIECAFSINLTALTLEQVLGKRKKVVADMCDQLAIKARKSAQADEWCVLRLEDEAAGAVPAAVDAFLNVLLQPLAEAKVEQYNENAPLGKAITEAVALADILSGWVDGLGELASQVNAEAGALVRSSEAFVLPKRMTVTRAVVCGLSALIWARSTFEIDLTERNLAPDELAMLARALRPTVTSLVLKNCDIAKGVMHCIYWTQSTKTCAHSHLSSIHSKHLWKATLRIANCRRWQPDWHGAARRRSRGPQASRRPAQTLPFSELPSAASWRAACQGPARAPLA